MLDHAFLEVIDVVRQSFADAMLDRLRHEERFQVDVLLGDATWEASYSLPGEGNPARLRADVTLDWPTWSQTAYRAWALGEHLEEPPELGIEVVVRVQGLAEAPDISSMASVLAPEGPSIGDERLVRAAPMVEQSYDSDLAGAEWAVEFAYEGTYEMSREALDHRATVATQLGGLGPWLASALVRVGDLSLVFRPEPDTGG